MNQTPKHLTYSSESEEGQKHSFSPEHMAALKGGAERRKKEQLVGNWIRVTNPALFAQLLHEATKPPTSSLLAQLEESLKVAEDRGTPEEAPILSSKVSVGDGSKAAGPSVEAAYDSRRPPPQLDIR